jgi:glycosyltransferase involved in cell wall biosynthesis
LNENLRYFQEHSGENDILCVAGEVGNLENPNPQKIIFLGNLAVSDLISLYKRSDWLIHLASQDHCPNVVVDARASGCRIVCAYSGGTPEIAGEDAILVVDECEYGFDAWDYNVPTTLDFSRNVPGIYEVDLSMDFVADRYLEFFEEFIK